MLPIQSTSTAKSWIIGWQERAVINKLEFYVRLTSCLSCSHKPLKKTPQRSILWHKNLHPLDNTYSIQYALLVPSLSQGYSEQAHKRLLGVLCRLRGAPRVLQDPVLCDTIGKIKPHKYSNQMTDLSKCTPREMLTKSRSADTPCYTQSWSTAQPRCVKNEKNLY